MHARLDPSARATLGALSLLIVCALGCGGGASSDPTGASDSAGGETPSADSPTPVQAWSSACADPIAALRDSGSATTFLALAERVGMAEVIAEMQGGTVFVPTDAAFAAAGLDAETLSADRAALRNTLAGHFTMGTMATESIQAEASLTLLDQARTELAVGERAGAVSLGPARLVRPDLSCPGIVIHLVDAVLPLGEFDPERSPSPFGVRLWVLPAE